MSAVSMIPSEKHNNRVACTAACSQTEKKKKTDLVSQHGLAGRERPASLVRSAGDDLCIRWGFHGGGPGRESVVGATGCGR